MRTVGLESREKELLVYNMNKKVLSRVGGAIYFFDII